MAAMFDSDKDATIRLQTRAGRRQTRVRWRANAVGEQNERAVRGGRDKSVRIGATHVGKGLFARRRYPADTVIGEIEGHVIEDPHYGSDYCMNIGDGRVLEPMAPFRYVNHSCEPNCEFDFFDLREAGQTGTHRRVFLIALREIKPGEELTIDYNWPAACAIPCRCRAPSCRGWIVRSDELDTLLARLAASACAVPLAAEENVSPAANSAAEPTETFATDVDSRSPASVPHFS